MKKFTLVFLLMSTLMAFGQTTKPTYNRWSIDFGIGGNTTLKDFTPGYRGAIANFGSAELGARFMFNSYFGIDLNYGWDRFTGRDGFPEFTTAMGRINFQGNVNLGNALNFHEFTDWFTIMAHAGVGTGNFDSSSFTAPFGNDKVGSIIMGLSPMFKLGNKAAIVTDVSWITYGRRHHTFDYATVNPLATPFRGMTWTYTIGLSWYLGGYDRHADWSPTIGVTQQDMDELRAEMEKIRKDMKDDDGDGVPNYMDDEAETPQGNAVDGRGVSDPTRMDTDKDGIPDAYDACPEEEGKFNTNGCPDGDGDGVADKDDKCPTTPGVMSNKGCPAGGAGSGSVVNMDPPLQAIYFDLGLSDIKNSEKAKLDKVVQVMKANPSYRLVVKGHTDKTGGFEMNVNLSNDRAQSVMNYLIKNEIDPARLDKVGYGPSFPAVSGTGREARSKNRRVEFEVRN